MEGKGPMFTLQPVQPPSPSHRFHTQRISVPVSQEKRTPGCEAKSRLAGWGGGRDWKGVTNSPSPGLVFN